MEHKDADVTTLKVKQLKALIQAAGLSHADCFEKSDLRARATQAQAKLAAAPAPKPKKKSLMEIHTAWRAECARAQAEYDATKHRYVERFQNFGRALFKAKRPEDDAEKIYDEELRDKALAMPGFRCTIAKLAEGEKNWTGFYFCKGNCGTCGERVPPYGEAAVCEKCGVASYCDAECIGRPRQGATP